MLLSQEPFCFLPVCQYVMQRFLSRPLAEQRSNSYAVLLAQDPFRFIPIHQSVFRCWPRASHQSPELAIHFYAMLLAQEPFRFLPLCANISSSAVHWGLFRNTDPRGLNFRAGPLGPNWCVSPPGFNCRPRLLCSLQPKECQSCHKLPLVAVSYQLCPKLSKVVQNCPKL